MHVCFEESLLLPRLPSLKWSDAEPFCQNDSNAAICLMKNRFTAAFGESARLLEQLWREQEEFPHDCGSSGFAHRDQARRHGERRGGEGQTELVPTFAL